MKKISYVKKGGLLVVARAGYLLIKIEGQPILFLIENPDSDQAMSAKQMEIDDRSTIDEMIKKIENEPVTNSKQ